MLQMNVVQFAFSTQQTESPAYYTWSHSFSLLISFPEQNTDIGKLKEMTVKKQKFKATISMADKHPLSLREQVLPIIKLLVSDDNLLNTYVAVCNTFAT